MNTVKRPVFFLVLPYFLKVCLFSKYVCELGQVFRSNFKYQVDFKNCTKLTTYLQLVIWQSLLRTFWLFLEMALLLYSEKSFCFQRGYIFFFSVTLVSFDMCLSCGISRYNSKKLEKPPSNYALDYWLGEMPYLGGISMRFPWQPYFDRLGFPNLGFSCFCQLPCSYFYILELFIVIYWILIVLILVGGFPACWKNKKSI